MKRNNELILDERRDIDDVQSYKAKSQTRGNQLPVSDM